MNHRDFAYWLQGYFELTDASSLTEEQVATIKEHLESTFDQAAGAGEPMPAVADDAALTDLEKLLMEGTPLTPPPSGGITFSPGPETFC